MRKLDPNLILQASVTGMSHDGRGIAHINGKTTFLLGALPGEEVKFTYTNYHRQYDEGKVIEVLSASPDRVSAKCLHFGTCGGCSLQHLAGDKQIQFKQNVLLEQLQHIGKVAPEMILPPLVGPLWGYRHKARLGVKFVAAKNKVLVGFRELNGRFLADIHQCEVIHPSVGYKMTALSELIQRLSIFREIPQIEVAISETQIALIIRHLKPLTENDLQILSEFEQRENLTLYLQPAGPNSVHRLRQNSYSSSLSYSLPAHHLKLNFEPSDFTQINVAINQQMIAQAIALLEPNEKDIILDLFCGLGNFTLPLSTYCQKVIGVEGEINAVKRGIANAKMNNIKNVEFYCANLTEEFIHYPWAKNNFTKILLDPPRTGALEVVKQLGRLKAEKILYISCNPATLARDAGELTKQDYCLRKAGVMDMFPHTSHVESIAYFEKI